MIKRVKLLSAAVVSAMAFAGSAGSALAVGDECLLNSGCFFVDPSDTSPGYWVCSDPSIYAMCLSNPE